MNPETELKMLNALRGASNNLTWYICVLFIVFFGLYIFGEWNESNISESMFTVLLIVMMIFHSIIRGFLNGWVKD